MARKMKSSKGKKKLTPKEKEAKLLQNYLSVVQEMLRDAKERGHGALAEISRKTGIGQNRLSELLHQTSPRKLNKVHVGQLMRSGVMTLNQFLQGREFDSLPEEERNLWSVLELTEDAEVPPLLREAKEKGIDLKALLKSIIKPRAN